MVSFYSLTKQQRNALVSEINKCLQDAFEQVQTGQIINYFSNTDTYIRRAAYVSVGKLFWKRADLQSGILFILTELIKNKDHLVRQTVVNTAGEIGKKDFEIIEAFFDTGLLDIHHTVRNAVIGSIKKMSAINPVPVLEWAAKYLHHDDKEIRREICHGIELRGRTHPQDILPLLKELQYDKTTRVRQTLVHVLGQIAYKKGCLFIVLNELKTWENTALIADVLEEIIDVHDRYKDFAALTVQEAQRLVDAVFSD